MTNPARLSIPFTLHYCKCEALRSQGRTANRLRSSSFLFGGIWMDALFCSQPLISPDVPPSLLWPVWSWGPGHPLSAPGSLLRTPLHAFAWGPGSHGLCPLLPFPPGGGELGFGGAGSCRMWVPGIVQTRPSWQKGARLLSFCRPGIS